MATEYDGVPYPGHPYPQSYPDRLATIALLFGLQPAPVDRCRVLEIGCGDGANLLPLAYTFPGSSHLGVDLAASAIEKGRAAAIAIGASNIDLRQMDIASASAALGQFDYIIVHGVFSWVAPELRERILSLCRESLAPSGIAYISYNVYPGGHLRDLVSGMMKFHVRRCSDPLERVGQARSLMQFLSQANGGHEKYGDFLQQEFERVQESDDCLIYHDDLSLHRDPVYFYQFVEQAARHGLQFLAEADFHEMQSTMYPPEVREKLAQLDSEVVLREQYLDFLKCRAFRQSLLVHQEAKFSATPSAQAVSGMFVGSRAKPASASPRLGAGEVETFTGPRGGAVKTDDPLTKAALLHLSRAWPRLVAFDELGRKAKEELREANISPATNVSELDPEVWLQLFSAGVVELHLHSPAFVLEPGERPTASALARHQVREGRIVTALNYAAVKLEDTLSRSLLALLDGTRDRPALRRELAALIRSGQASASANGGHSPAGTEEVVRLMEERLEANLQRFGQFPLLTS